MLNVSKKFESVASLRSALWHEFSDTIPDEGEFNVGYFEGKQHTKKWLISSQDVDVMYAYFEGKQSINLWCDGKVTRRRQPKRSQNVISKEVTERMN